jgi:integrase
MTLAPATAPIPSPAPSSCTVGRGGPARFAVEAAGERDVEKLWRLVEAHLTLHGASGVGTSVHTLRAYRRGVVELLTLWAGESLLRPARDAGALYVQRLRAGDREPVHAEAEPGKRGAHPKKGPLAPATVELRLAAARALYDALRWAGATEADPFRDVRTGRDVDREEDVAGLKVYTEYELIELLGRAEEPEDRVLVLLGAHAGLRVSEMLALRWDEVDVGGRELLVKGRQGEQDRPRAAHAAARTKLEALAPPAPRRGRRRTRSCSRSARSTASTGACGGSAARRGPLQGRARAAPRRRHQALPPDGRPGQVQDHLRHATLDMARRYARSDRRKLRGSLDTSATVGRRCSVVLVAGATRANARSAGAGSRVRPASTSMRRTSSSPTTPSMTPRAPPGRSRAPAGSDPEPPRRCSPATTSWRWARGRRYATAACACPTTSPSSASTTSPRRGGSGSPASVSAHGSSVRPP